MNKENYVINEVEYNCNYLNQLNELAKMNIPTRKGLKNVFIVFLNKGVNFDFQKSCINRLNL